MALRYPEATSIFEADVQIDEAHSFRYMHVRYQRGSQPQYKPIKASFSLFRSSILCVPLSLAPFSLNGIDGNLHPISPTDPNLAIASGIRTTCLTFLQVLDETTTQ
jgi:hypothetical protein